MDEQRASQQARRDFWQICLRCCSCQHFQRGSFASSRSHHVHDTSEGGKAAPVATVPTIDLVSMTQEEHIAYAMEMSGQTGEKSIIHYF